MNYKKIIRSRSLRIKILRFLSFIPDKLMLSIQYRIKTGRKLNLKDPVRFTEKLQWYKLYYKDPLMIRCVDKYDVRDYVKSKGLEEILVPCYGVFDNQDDIDWERLPNQFVMKDTLGGGGNSVLIVGDKEEKNISLLRNIAGQWVNISTKHKSSGREWPYYSGKAHRVLFEQLIKSSDPGGLIDYKFFCFNGKCEFLYVMGDRTVGQSVKVSIFDREFNQLQVARVGDLPFEEAIKPDRFEEMIQVAERLAEDFPHVRVDLYNIQGRIMFGELTFYNASGYMEYNPDSFDVEIGRKWLLPQTVKD